MGERAVAPRSLGYPSTGFEIITGLYFGRPYGSEIIPYALSLIAPRIESAITVIPSEFGEDHATWQAFSNQGHSRLVPLRVNAHGVDWRALMSGKVPERIEGRFITEAVPFQVIPRISMDETYTLELYVPIEESDGDASAVMWPLFDEADGEVAMARFFGHLDPIWACSGVEVLTPSITEVARGEPPIQTSLAYLGSWFVGEVGRDRLLETMRGAFRTEWQPSGGVYFRWPDSEDGAEGAQRLEQLILQAMGRYVNGPPPLPLWKPSP
jgi:hypothetical protein